MYGAETWPISGHNNKKILAPEMDALTRFATISKLDKIRKYVIREKMKSKKTIMEESISECRLPKQMYRVDY